MKDKIFPRTFDKQIVYLKNVINTPDIEVGDYTMYNDFVHDPIDFEKIMFCIIILLIRVS